MYVCQTNIYYLLFVIIDHPRPGGSAKDRFTTTAPGGSSADRIAAPVIILITAAITLLLNC